jgi:uncharacterized protein (DUF433 family)
MRLEINEFIVADTDVCHGKPTFKWTRIMVWQVLEMMEAGETINGILEDYPPLTRDHIRAALRLADQRVPYC